MRVINHDSGIDGARNSQKPIKVSATVTEPLGVMALSGDDLQQAHLCRKWIIRKLTNHLADTQYDTVGSDMSSCQTVALTSEISRLNNVTMMIQVAGPGVHIGWALPANLSPILMPNHTCHVTEMKVVTGYNGKDAMKLEDLKKSTAHRDLVVSKRLLSPAQLRNSHPIFLFCAVLELFGCIVITLYKPSNGSVPTLEVSDNRTENGIVNDLGQPGKHRLGPLALTLLNSSERLNVARKVWNVCFHAGCPKVIIGPTPDSQKRNS
ncbi:hypothetical protein LIA77_00673 [Sarocladium implicatum]|nr:hypothetical protein LIA77_00673 [Sarocladium implicatum]